MKVNVFKNKGVRSWLITSVSLIVFFVIVLILAETVFFELLTGVLGPRMTKNFGGGTYYVSDYDDKEDAFKKANLLNEKINEEGIILLKNEGNALPLAQGSRISVFGKNSVNLSYGGSGSGAFTVTSETPTLYDSLEAAGFVYNTVLHNFYSKSNLSGSGRPDSPGLDNGRGTYSGMATGETPISKYTQDIRNSYANFSDAALVVFTRIGGESYDLPRTMIDTEGALDPADHYLELDKNEQDMLVEACNNFNKVIVIINSSTQMELGFLDNIDDNDLTLVSGMANIDTKIQGALWIGGPGYSGIMALGRVLKGTVNPSGRTIDLYQRDFTKDPTYQNFSDYLVENGNQYLPQGGGTQDITEHYVDYEEGIYLGYRYYETRGLGNETWYNNNVVFPFGYGLSYTTFTWTLKDASFDAGEELTWTQAQDQKFTLTVTVKNTGSVAGKDVVQVYVTAPYTQGEIEKSYIVLTGFAKTSLLNPNQQEDVVIEFNGYDFASYDFDDKNNNTFRGYELDSGLYTVRVMKNSHTEVLNRSFTLTSNVQYRNDTTTGTVVENLYDDVSFEENYGMESVLSRTNFAGTFPVNEVLNGSNAERTVPQEFLNKIKDETYINNPIYTQDNVPMPEQATVASPDSTEQLFRLIMFDENDEVIRDDAGTTMVLYNDARWDNYLNILTVNEMMDFTMKGAFKTTALSSIGLMPTFSSDGPVGFVFFLAAIESSNPVYKTCSYASECVIAATWNTELAYEMGQSVGNEGIIGNQRGDKKPYAGWYAPAVNLHRTPFSGRNFEYYSEDPFISGKLAAQVVLGARSRGVYCQVKHFCVNDQETNRSGVCTWLTEQSLRELYLKPFEIAVKEGGAMGVMSSFNRIGTLWTGGDYRLLTTILRDEWGFKGLVICDFNTEPFMNTKQMCYAGGDLNLATLPKSWNATTAADITVLRQATKNILYTISRSNAMNGSGEGGYYIEYYAWWETVLQFLPVALALGFAVWGFFAITKAKKELALEVDDFSDDSISVEENVQNLNE